VKVYQSNNQAISDFSYIIDVLIIIKHPRRQKIHMAFHDFSLGIDMIHHLEIPEIVRQGQDNLPHADILVFPSLSDEIYDHYIK